MSMAWTAVIIALFVLAIYAFMISYHSLDLSVNAIYNGLCSYTDTGVFGNLTSARDMYLRGMAGMFISFWIYNFAVIILLLLYLRKHKF